MQAKNIRRRTRGFSLVELMVVIAVVAILSAIALGAYRQYMLRTNRTDGTMVLLKLQAAEEKYFLQNNTYTANLGTDGLGVTGGTGVTSMTTARGFYTIAVAAGATTTLATSYLLTAAAAAGQVKDTSCPTLTIDDQGIHGPSSTAATCWH
jgi:type IV pilus assembly protein PilE